MHPEETKIVNNARPLCACVPVSENSIRIHGVGSPLARRHIYRIFQALGFTATVPIYHGVVGSAAVYITSSKSYIVYNRYFFNRWHPIYPELPVSYLAHEVGHIVSRKQKNPNSHIRELEAEKISGFVMKRLGATAEQAILRLNLFPSEATTTYPDSDRRKEAILEGYYAAQSHDFA